ncbi:MAG: DegV family protein [Anaerolineae bacterium]|nr:DegV family protein [Anaerolineae bacterium]
MKRFAVVTDSTSNLSPGLAEPLGIPVIPCTVHWGEESYLDGVTLDAETFYRWLGERSEFPKTSQPSAGAFIDFFQQVAQAEDVDTVLAVLVSSDLSGTVSSAVQAKARLAELRPDLRIELVDSRSVSMGLGLQAMVAKAAADAGKSLEEAVAEVRRCLEASHVLFAVDTLEYLFRGGRIGNAARLLGSALNLKPVLTIGEGRVEPLEKVRSRAKSLRRVVEIAESRLQGRQPVALSIIHAEADADLPEFTEMVAQRLRPAATYTRVLTPVVGTHGGPGTLGIAFYTE